MRALPGFIVCPACLGPLIGGPAPGGTEPSAWYHCLACSLYYPVVDGLPMLLAARASPDPASL
ncbi:MAG TPA: hypothetical protein VGD59_01220 [Acidisarcina sp.]